MNNHGPRPKPRLAILTNTLAPYRLPIYRRLSEHFELAVFVAGRESNRGTWLDLETQLARLGIYCKRSWGMSLHRTTGFDERYLHITPGYLLDLVRYEPAAIITNEMGARTALALLYGFLLRKPVWVWWGGTRHTEQRIGRLKRIVRRVFRTLVRRWITYGATSTEYLLSLGVDPERILQVQNSVDETLYSTSIAPMLSCQPRPVLLYVGQMIGRKGVRQLLEAANRVRRLGHAFSLLLVGDGPEAASLKAHADKLGLDNVHFSPAQAPSAMPSVYRSGDVLVFPTLRDPWGLVVNEALWSGLPVIASIYAGCASEILPMKNRFDPLDPEDFDQALVRAVTQQLPRPDTSVLLRSDRVAELMAQDIVQALDIAPLAQIAAGSIPRPPTGT